jgi:peptide deformylase
MAVREIRLFGDPVLKSVCDPVKTIDAGIEALVQDLLDTTALPGRAGVAANQIGVGLRVFSYSVEGKTGYVINPELIAVDGESELVDEGCLSVPGLWHKTSRYERATVRGLQLDNSIVEISANGVLAQAFQHECDHLDGLLYLDRLEQAERKLAMQAIRSSEWFLRN